MDPWANANRIQVEEDKPAKEQGYYLHPDLYGQPEEKGISYLLFPKDKREVSDFDQIEIICLSLFFRYNYKFHFLFCSYYSKLC
jgi:hypothetical protein